MKRRGWQGGWKWSHSYTLMEVLILALLQTAIPIASALTMTAHRGGKQHTSPSVNSLTFTLGSNAVHAKSSDTRGASQVKPAAK